MPTYVYACKSCAHRFEQYQSFSEDSLVTCPECAEDALRKVFDSVGIVFKGSGFYSTDSQTSGASTAASSSSSSSESAADTSTTSAAPAAADSSTTASSSATYAQPVAAAAS
ncbi:FmdB family zinc ribbon protein [Brachybacterium paraconglomeratum]|uniref:FmdB family zinc ribbon protein n=1 Tax=Brachybacterium paraconglomeratum TaxID=173362 RepID=UPI0031EB2504